MITYDEFISFDNIHLAYKRLQTMVGDYYKELYRDDFYNFGMDLDENVNHLINKIINHTYQPNKSHKIYIPKQNNWVVRQISVINFEDLLVYQAIANLIAEAYYYDFEPFYNKYIYGNIYNKTNDPSKQIYFYEQWQVQWKKFKNQSKSLYKKGYKFYSEFDIASFYDTIDHALIRQNLIDKLDMRIIDLLMEQLQCWTIDQERNNGKLKHGIPQGPISSAILSETCLLYIDKIMKNKVREEKDIFYIRYADDIRIFSKDNRKAKRYLAFLDLLVRDLGLIPQSTKLAIRTIENVEDIFKIQDRLSLLNSTIKKHKSLGLKEEQELVDSAINTITSGTFEKSIIRFTLYRVGADNNLKLILITHADNLFSIFDDVCYYLSKHYQNDKDVMNWVYSLLNETELVFHYPIAVLFKFFYKVINFDFLLYQRFFSQSIRDKHWYVRYYMLKWIAEKNPELLLGEQEESNVFILRHLLHLKYEKSNTKVYKDLLVNQMIRNSKMQVALMGRYIEIMEDVFGDGVNIGVDDNLNNYVKNIYKINLDENYIQDCLKEKGISTVSFFDNILWTDENEYARVRYLFSIQEKFEEVDSMRWVSSTNEFNKYIITKLLNIFHKYELLNKEYTDIIESTFIKDSFPHLQKCFKKINKRYIHYSSLHGTINNHYDFKELKQLRNIQIEGLKELLENFDYIHQTYLEASASLEDDLNDIQPSS